MTFGQCQHPRSDLTVRGLLGCLFAVLDIIGDTSKPPSQVNMSPLKLAIAARFVSPNLHRASIAYLLCRLFRLIGFLLSLLLAGTTLPLDAAPHSDSKPRITLDEFFNAVDINKVALSPDGHSVAIATERADWDARTFSRRPLAVARERRRADSADAVRA